LRQRTAKSAPFSGTAMHENSLIGPELRGHIEFFGFHEAAGGLVFGGWVTRASIEPLQAAEFVVTFSIGELVGRGTVAFCPSDENAATGLAAIIFVPAPDRPLGNFISIKARGHRGELRTASGHM